MGVDDPIRYTKRTVEIEGGRKLYLYDFEPPKLSEQTGLSEQTKPLEPPNSPAPEPKR